MTHRQHRPASRGGGLLQIRPQFSPHRFTNQHGASNGLSTLSTPPTTTPKYSDKTTAEVAL